MIIKIVKLIYILHAAYEYQKLHLLVCLRAREKRGVAMRICDVLLRMYSVRNESRCVCLVYNSDVGNMRCIDMLHGRYEVGVFDAVLPHVTHNLRQSVIVI